LNARSNSKPKPFIITKKIPTILFFAILTTSFSILVNEHLNHQLETPESIAPEIDKSDTSEILQAVM